MVLYGIWWYWMVLDGIAWYSMVLNGIALYWIHSLVGLGWVPNFNWHQHCSACRLLHDYIQCLLQCTHCRHVVIQCLAVLYLMMLKLNFQSTADFCESFPLLIKNPITQVGKGDKYRGDWFRPTQLKLMPSVSDLSSWPRCLPFKGFDIWWGKGAPFLLTASWILD